MIFLPILYICLYNHSYNYILLITAMSHLERYAKDQREKLLISIFNHIHALPYYQIKHSIILVSYTDDHKFVFEKITEKPRAVNDKYPFISKLNDNSRILDPTMSFLRPETDTNFVTMHYVMNLVEQAKFIFIFNSADTTSIPFQNIKQTFIRFISMFKNLNKNQLDQLITSCGIIITDANSSTEIDTYCQRLSFIREQGFLEKKYNSVKFLAENILSNKRVILSKKGSSLPKDFMQLVSKLTFFKLEGKVFFNLTSNYKNFIAAKSHLLWSQVFQKFYKGINEIILGKGKEIQREIYNQIKNYDKRNQNLQQEKKQLDKNSPFKSLQILSALDNMMQMVIKFTEYDGSYKIDLDRNKQFLAQFLGFVYSQKLIKNQFIKQFFMNYFIIHSILSTKSDDANTDLFHKVNFFDHYITGQKEFNFKMRTLSLQFFNQLQNDLAGNINHYPISQCIDLLTNLLKYKDVKFFSFFTDRIYKKIIKERASLAYQLIQISKNKKMKMKNSLNFIRWSSESKLIKDKLKIQVLISIALELAQDESAIEIALHIFNILPQYQVFKHVQYIYQKQLSINAQLLQYMPKDKRKALLQKHFEGYYIFLLKIGFEETVRQVSMECLRLAEGEEQRNYFKNALVKARGSTFRDLHKTFLEKSVLQEKQIIITSELVDNIEYELASRNII